jgi:hypothetical protein
MYLLHDLKERIGINKDTVECPIIGCRNHVKRQTSKFLREPEFHCEVHQIYISASTFECANELDNLLWQEEEDTEYLMKIKKVKRESRIARERSEDALTWNVFRYLEKHELIGEVVERFTSDIIVNPEIIYWSYSEREAGISSLLKEARRAFNERAGTEPDIIINSRDHIVFIEAKFTSGNKTKPKNLGPLQTYATLNNRWYQNVFQTDISKVCIENEKYELMRNYLLGTWLAYTYNKKFTFLSLNAARFSSQTDLNFKELIKENDQFRYIYSVWEELREVIQNHLPESSDKDMVLDYLRNKSAGYRNGKVVKAFV